MKGEASCVMGFKDQEIPPTLKTNSTLSYNRVVQQFKGYCRYHIMLNRVLLRNTIVICILCNDIALFPNPPAGLSSSCDVRSVTHQRHLPSGRRFLRLQPDTISVSYKRQSRNSLQRQQASNHSAAIN